MGTKNVSVRMTEEFRERVRQLVQVRYDGNVTLAAKQLSRLSGIPVSQRGLQKVLPTRNIEQTEKPRLPLLQALIRAHPDEAYWLMTGERREDPPAVQRHVERQAKQIVGAIFRELARRMEEETPPLATAKDRYEYSIRTAESTLRRVAERAREGSADRGGSDLPRGAHTR